MDCCGHSVIFQKTALRYLMLYHDAVVTCSAEVSQVGHSNKTIEGNCMERYVREIRDE